MARVNECAAVGCNALILPFAIFCDRCWRLVPSDLKRIIEHLHKPNRRPSKRLEVFIASAVAELLMFKTEGHYIPRGQMFEWTDDAPAPAAQQLTIDEALEKKIAHEANPMDVGDRDGRREL